MILGKLQKRIMEVLADNPYSNQTDKPPKGADTPWLLQTLYGDDPNVSQLNCLNSALRGIEKRHIVRRFYCEDIERFSLNAHYLPIHIDSKSKFWWVLSSDALQGVYDLMRVAHKPVEIYQRIEAPKPLTELEHWLQLIMRE